MTAPAFVASAQFKSEAFSQSYAEESDTTGRDTTDTAFTFKEYFGGIRHVRDARIGVMFSGSAVFIGGQQMYNRQYWKLPVIYGSMAATTGLGLWYRHKWDRDLEDRHYQHLSNWCFAGAGLAWWGTLMDGLYNYRRDIPGQPGKATLYSLMLPGLGQAYNGEYWKIPIYYGCLVGATHYLLTNNTNYKRYKRIHNEATAEDGTYTGPVSAETALYYRDVFRRYRDYSIVAVMGFYLLQVIDANVFAYMRDFELSDDIALQVAPALISPGSDLALAGGLSGSPACGSALPGGPSGYGFRIGLRF